MTKLTHTQRGAAEVLGVSLDFFQRHVLSEIAVARVGRRTLIPHSELEKWLERQAKAI